MAKKAPRHHDCLKHQPFSKSHVLLNVNDGIINAVMNVDMFNPRSTKQSDRARHNQGYAMKGAEMQLD
ncbi:uncharacterized protein TRIVIDRAFT_215847 [Trichoderma virens Gv29-8]|uniref:Uncharacterized protein n=1 Tax=Hypocrea virens (strain Gv29-8 / FGSC 10586) TaxID=413071 RepID=G9MP32_HYPVG|nr:uncharacterized protein TRIVIDRAFT_215847 [Trichoderma virens Gv29-8]EHK23634.1 hypothetical protein TRIVIDRAFT_215847 [Trichoderma virens Gv29-8]